MEGWLQEERLQASNMFGPRCETWASARTNVSPQVLGYVFVSVCSEIVTCDVGMLYEGRDRGARTRLSDHALVRVET